MKLVVGLGNPGRDYEGTRHNVGFMVVERLAREWGLSGKPAPRFNAVMAEGQFAGGKVILAQPTTFMNESGRSVRALTDFYKVSADDLLVVYDDLAIPLGAVRLRLAGSAGGHNGVASVIACLGTQQFPRLRVGVGPLPPGWSMVNFVLGRFGVDEATERDQGLSRAIEAIRLGMQRGWDEAMNQFNRRDLERVPGAATTPPDSTRSAKQP